MHYLVTQTRIYPMKCKKIQPLLISTLFIFLCFPALSQNVSDKQCLTLRDFAMEVFDAIKTNEFERVRNILPEAPFTLNLEQAGQGKPDVEISPMQMASMIENLEYQFGLIRTQLREAKIHSSELTLEYIESVYEGDINFMAVEIYLRVGSTNSDQLYSIRIEDCFHTSGTLLPESLKWEGKWK